MPDSATVCALLPALSVTDSEPVMVPLALGSKSTRMLHFAPAASEVPQLLLWEKLALIAIPLMLSAVVPVFVSVTVWLALLVPTVWLANVRLLGDMLADVVDVDAAAPVPLKLTVCALVLALVVIDNVPALAPAAFGVNVTEIVQREPEASDVPQLLLSEKLPLVVMALMLSVLLPLFVNVTC